MNEYEQQAQDFLKKTNTKFSVRFLENGFHFTNDKEERDIYQVKLEKNGREFVFNFGTSINDTQKRLREYINNNGLIQQRQEEDLKLWDCKVIKNQEIKPTAYDILAGLTTYQPEDNIDDFAGAYGYYKPSEAIRVFEAVNKEYNELCKLFSADEMEMLSEIN